MSMYIKLLHASRQSRRFLHSTASRAAPVDTASARTNGTLLLPTKHSSKRLPAVCTDLTELSETTEYLLTAPYGSLFEYEVDVNDQASAWKLADPTVQQFEYIFRGYARLIPGTTWQRWTPTTPADPAVETDPEQLATIVQLMHDLTERVWGEGHAYMSMREERMMELQEQQNEFEQTSGHQQYLDSGALSEFADNPEDFWESDDEEEEYDDNTDSSDMVDAEEDYREEQEEGYYEEQTEGEEEEGEAALWADDDENYEEHGEGYEGEHDEGYEGEHDEGYEGEHDEGYEGEHDEGYEGEQGHDSDEEQVDVIDDEQGEDYDTEQEGFDNEVQDEDYDTEHEGFDNEVQDEDYDEEPDEDYDEEQDEEYYEEQDEEYDEEQDEEYDEEQDEEYEEQDEEYDEEQDEEYDEEQDEEYDEEQEGENHYVGEADSHYVGEGENYYVGEGERYYGTDSDGDSEEEDESPFFDDFAFPGPTTVMFDTTVDAMACAVPHFGSASHIPECLEPDKAHVIMELFRVRHEIDGGDAQNINIYTRPTLQTYNALIHLASAYPFDRSSERHEHLVLRDNAVTLAFSAFDLLTHSKLYQRNSATYSYLLQTVAKYFPPSLSKGNIALGMLRYAQEEGVMDPTVWQAFRNANNPTNGAKFEKVLEEAHHPKFKRNVKKRRNNPREPNY